MSLRSLRDIIFDILRMNIPIEFIVGGETWTQNFSTTVQCFNYYTMGYHSSVYVKIRKKTQLQILPLTLILIFILLRIVPLMFWIFIFISNFFHLWLKPDRSLFKWCATFKIGHQMALAVAAPWFKDLFALAALTLTVAVVALNNLKIQLSITSQPTRLREYHITKFSISMK